MNETPQQYMHRVLGYTKGRNPLRVQLETPKRLAQLVHGVPKRTLMRRPRKDKWSVGEVLAHLAETELLFGFRLRMVLSKNGTPIQAMDQEAWARVSKYRTADPDRSLEMFTVLRENNLVLLVSLPRRMWSHYGLHEERGRETVRRMAQMMAGHDLNHLRQVESILGAGR
jgi:hypothetical protein